MKPSKELADKISSFLGIFFWNFKRKDNVVYNFEILHYMHSIFKNEDDLRCKRFIIKPAIIIEVSIAECVIFDFLKRINEHVSEKIPNLTTEKISHVQDDFRKLLKNRKKDKYINLDDMLTIIYNHKLLDKTVDNQKLYDSLKMLKEVRNKIHIQDNNKNLNENEFNIFDEDLLVESQNILENIISVLVIHYPRPWQNNLDINDFPYPWNEPEEIQESATGYCPSCGEQVFNIINRTCPNCMGEVILL